MESSCKLYLNERKESEKNEFPVSLLVNAISAIWYKKRKEEEKKNVTKTVHFQAFDDILGYI